MREKQRYKKKHTWYEDPPERYTRVHNGVPALTPVRVIRTSTGEDVPVSVFNHEAGSVLSEYASIVNRLIQLNSVEDLPVREKGEKPNMHARRVITLPDDQDDLITGYAERAWTIIAAQLAATSIITPYQLVRAVWRACHDENGEPIPMPSDLSKELDRYVDGALVRNTARRSEEPRVPLVKTPVMRYGSMGTQCGYRLIAPDALLLHALAVGPERYEVLLDPSMLWDRYPELTGVSMPNMRLVNGQVLIDLDVIENSVITPVTMNSVVAFDRNADHGQCFSGVRLTSNGWVSRELGPSVQTIRTVRHLNKLRDELKKTQAALEKRVTSNHRKTKLDLYHDERTSTQIDRLKAKIQRLEDAVDDSQAEDMLRHANPGEAIIVEELKWFTGSSTFRHGSTTDALEHKCERAGVRLIKVNPANTTAHCPCGEPVSINTSTHIATCMSGSPHGEAHPDGSRGRFRMNRHVLAAVNIGLKGLAKLGYDATPDRFLASTHSPTEEAETSKRRVARSKRKNQSRSARGHAPRAPKNHPTPRRPRNSRTPLTQHRDEWLEVIKSKQEGNGTRSRGNAVNVTGLPVGKWTHASIMTREDSVNQVNTLFKDLAIPKNHKKKSRTR